MSQSRFQGCKQKLFESLALLLWSSVNLLICSIVETKPLMIKGSSNLTFTTAPRVTSVSSFVTYSWVWSLTSEKKKKKNTFGGEKNNIFIAVSYFLVYFKNRVSP